MAALAKERRRVDFQGGARATLSLHFDGAVGRLMGRMTEAVNNRYLGFEAAGLERRSEASTGHPGPGRADWPSDSANFASIRR
jgi:hypothetical protein